MFSIFMYVLIGIEQTVTGRHSTSRHMTDRSFGSSLLTRREIFPLDIALCLTSCTGSIEHDRLRVCMSDGGLEMNGNQNMLEKSHSRSHRPLQQILPRVAAMLAQSWESLFCPSVRLSVCHTRAL